MSTIDQFYTPPWLAGYIAGLIPKSTTSAVDLAAGGGALLAAAANRFARLTLGAVDVDGTAVRNLRRVHPTWHISRADALIASSYRNSAAFRNVPNGYDAVLLNPPFSYRGQSRERVFYRGSHYRVTPATSFVLEAFNWLSPIGVVIAIVPENIVNIEGDRDLWDIWRSQFRLEQKRILGRNTFQGARTTAMVVVLSPMRPAMRHSRFNQRELPAVAPAVDMSTDCRCVEIIRGRVPVHRAAGLACSDGKPFVHTTSLNAGGTHGLKLRLPSALATKGPLVLLPRVGQPRPEKIVRARVRSVVLSDCVIGIRATEPGVLQGVHDVLTGQFADLLPSYTGSCAPYITIDRLVQWLALQGFKATQCGASEEPTRCGCRNPAA